MVTAVYRCIEVYQISWHSKGVTYIGWSKEALVRAHMVASNIMGGFKRCAIVWRFKVGGY